MSSRYPVLCPLSSLACDTPVHWAMNFLKRLEEMERRAVTQELCNAVCPGPHMQLTKVIYATLAGPDCREGSKVGEARRKLRRSTQYQLCQCLLSPPGAGYLGNI